MDEVLRGEHAESIERRLAHEADALQTNDPETDMRMLPEVEAFVGKFAVPTRRRPMLAIVGATNLGKSMLAASVLRRVAVSLGLPGFLVATVEDDSNLDLSEFNVICHAGVVLDGVGDAL